MVAKDKENIILADCNIDEVKSFAEGCNEISKQPFRVKSKISNWGYNGKIRNFYRYVLYFIFPFRIFLRRKRYSTIIGWQQFYAINFAFFLHLLRVKKWNTVVVANFTYKKKNGLTGKIYHSYMKFSCNNKYVDRLHVLSYDYVQTCCNDLGVSPDKFIVTSFGIPDTYNVMKGLKAPLKNYSLAIGRSNRDFGFLVETWRQECLKDKTLVIISDVWKPAAQLPVNIIHRNDVKYQEQFAWFNNCNLLVTPIADGRICSGDTVLLTGMMFAKPVVVTSPSTLAEMYVKDGENGIHVAKDPMTAARKISELLDDETRMSALGNAARTSFIEKFSRKSMGKSIYRQIKTLVE